jgi:D-lactate dehydrogenase
MNIAFFSAQDYETPLFEEVNETFTHTLSFLEAPLNMGTVPLAEGHDAVCVFVNDQLNNQVLEGLAERHVHAVALRCSGFNNVDLPAAERLGIQVVRVPAYSPHAVAEHTLSLMTALNRKTHRAFNRVREGNFTLNGLMGFDFHGKTAGIIGTGKIGQCMARILNGLGMTVLGYDVYPSDAARDAGITFVNLEDLWSQADVISLHCPLTPETKHLINARSLQQMKPGVMIVNTSRGGVVDTAAVIQGLKTGIVGSLGLDVYEEEGDIFFRNLSDQVLQDDQLARLLTFPNVIITGHQAFFTREALNAIASTTLMNLQELENTGSCGNAVKATKVIQ